MFKSANVGVAWGGGTLKHIKSIKIVKQHARKPILRGRNVPIFCCLTIKILELEERGYNPRLPGWGWIQVWDRVSGFARGGWRGTSGWRGTGTLPNRDFTRGVGCQKNSNYSRQRSAISGQEASGVGV